MPSEITMPQLSDTMTEGTLVKWSKKAGEKVRQGEEIAEVETDKASMPMEAFDGGTLAVVKVKEGEKVSVGALLGVIAVEGEDVEEVKKQYAGEAKAPKKEQAAEKKTEEKKEAKPQAVGVGTAVAQREAPVDREAPAAPPRGNGRERPVRVSPLARRIAEERGIDLSQLQGSGPGGRIIQRDVESAKPTAPSRGAALAKKAPPISLAPKIPPGQKQSVPLNKMRTVIAQRMQQSKQTAPHFYETIEADVEQLAELREQMNRALEAEDIRLSLGDLIARAIAVALQVHPALNAHFANNEIVRFGDVNLGIAVALEDGLIVPVLRGVQQMSVRDIRQASADLVERARKQSLKQNELSGATFTVSNLGTYGLREFSAIINPPEVAILAVGVAEKRPAVVDGQIVPRTRMTLTLSVDHRAVDGATAAEFMRTLKTILEAPGMMLV